MAQQWNSDGNFYYDDTQFAANGNALNSANQWGDWLGNNGIANARGYTKLNNYMGDLSKNYGLGEQDFIKAFQSYGVNYQPTANEYANTAAGFGNDKDMPWWGEDAMLRALGTGLDTVNPNAAYKGSWQSLWNQGTETQQQNQLASDYDKAQKAYSVSSNFMNDIPAILGGIGLVTGIGGLAGAFGGAGSALGGGEALSSPLTGAGSFELGSAVPPLGAGDGIASGLAAQASAGSGSVLGGVGSFNAGLTGGALGGIAGAGAATLPSFSATSGATTGAADAVGQLPEVVDAGGTATGSGGNMDWTDFFTNDPGADASSFGGDAWNGAMNSGGSDWASGLDTAMNPGNQGATGFFDQAKSLLSQGKNIPASLIKSMFGTDDATSAGLAKLFGTAIGGVMDYNASSNQADALKAIADRSWAAGQPYRDRANAAMTPGFDVRSIPGLSSAMDTATETYLRKLSATNGNPAGIGAAPSQTEAFVLGNVALPAWQNYFNANSNAGGLSNLSAQSNATATQAAGADAATYGSLGQTARNIFDPQPDNSRYLNLLAKQFGLV